MNYSHLSLPLTLVLVLFNFVQLNGQEKSITLATNLSGSTKEYVARDNISLLPGFEFAATSGKFFNASIDPTLIFPPPANYLTDNGTITTNPAQGGAVGSIPGQFAVSSTGAATYTIPIECPPGINGMQPNISLVYNSQGGNGIAGWGWNISGLSAITRVPQNFYFDEQKSSIIWDNTSPYALDGQRLIEVNRWGNDSIEYTTEQNNFCKIIGHDIQTWGPLFFIVNSKDGRILKYGNPENLGSYRPVSVIDRNQALTLNNMYRNLCWSISLITDQNGNNITYTYGCNIPNQSVRENKALEIFLDEIKYGGNDVGITASEVVKFEYSQRSVSLSNFMDGYHFVSTLILNKIKLNSQNANLNEYQLNYIYNDNKEKLSKVTLRGLDGHNMTPVEFEWSPNNFTINFQGRIEYPSPPLLNQYQNEGYNDGLWLSRLFGDIDGDGDQDILLKMTLLNVVNNSWGWIPFVPDQNREFKYIWALYRNDGGVFTFIRNENWNKKNSIFFNDYDNDSAEELFIGWDSKSINDLFYQFDIYKYMDGVFSSARESIQINGSNAQENKIVHTGDFLGNGDNQYVFFYISEDGDYCPANYTHGIHSGDIPSSTHGGVKLLTTDMNNNGKAELMYISENGVEVYEAKRTSRTAHTFELIYQGLNTVTDENEVVAGDFNGDGNSDLIVKNPESNTLDVYFSNGVLYVKNLSSLSLSDSFYSRFIVVDANKDGRSDILIFNYSSSTSSYNIKLLAFEEASGFVEKATSNYNGCIFGETRGFGRINNDHNDDIILSDPFDFMDPYFSISDGMSFNRIVKIKNTSDKSIEITYNKYDAKQLKQRNLSYSSNLDPSEYPISMSTMGNWEVVYETFSKMSDGTIIAKQTYAYDSAVIHRQGKGFLGCPNPL